MVSKLSRYEFERNRHRHLTDIELEKMLQKRGTNYDKMMHHHNLHKMFEKRFIDTLRDMGIEVKVVNRYNIVFIVNYLIDFDNLFVKL